MRESSLVFAVLVLAVLVTACGSESADDGPPSAAGLTDPSHTFTEDQLREVAALAKSPGEPTDPTNAVADDDRAAHLGQFLFFDTRLSSTGEHSCASCHRPDQGFSSARQLSEAVGVTSRHAPTLINSAYQKWFVWDGRADSLWAQATGPLEAPHEQGTDRLQIAHLIDRDAQLRASYEAVFGALPDLSDTDRFPESGRPIPSQPDQPQHRAWMSMTDADRETINSVFTNVTKAIAAYEMRLISLDAPFDRYAEGLRTGNAELLDTFSEREKLGLELFVGKARCNRCHGGAMFSNFEFHNLGLAPRSWLDPQDEGRYSGIPRVKANPFNATGDYSDAPDSAKADELRFLAQKSENRGQFKTPSLRNVTQTAPYMHGGHFETLEEVVEFYNELDESPVLVGHRDETLQELELTDAEVDALVAFLETLTGEPIPDHLRRQPASPSID
jgi:cytochrome c peroxidase